MLAPERKRQFTEDGEATGSAVLPGAAQPLPQLSTTRTLAALAAGTPGMQPLEAPVGLGKPVLCRFFLRNACAKGKMCTFSHEVKDLPSVPIDQKARMSCRFFELGQCNRGATCKFAHGEAELLKVINMPRTKRSKAEAAEANEAQNDGDSTRDAIISSTLSSAFGFQNFEQFDPERSEKTELEARVDVKAAEARVMGKVGEAGGGALEGDDAEGPSLDDNLWQSFLAEVGEESQNQAGDGDAEGGGQSSGSTSAARPPSEDRRRAAAAACDGSGDEGPPGIGEVSGQASGGYGAVGSGEPTTWDADDCASTSWDSWDDGGCGSWDAFGDCWDGKGGDWAGAGGGWGAKAGGGNWACGASDWAPKGARGGCRPEANGGGWDPKGAGSWGGGCYGKGAGASPHWGWMRPTPSGLWPRRTAST
mmetsp:Transcript_35509/g.98149  ORF Transcript_35509/g.98149 Transcript_35509/m.98149 type:complete len:421 (-) Transcript_35509:120-1382(-)